MTFRLRYQNTVKDIWCLSMLQLYTSMIGVVNVIFTVALLAATIALWTSIELWMRLLMLAASLLFILIQPCSIWFRAKKSAQQFTSETDLLINDRGIYVTVNDQHEDLGWNRIKAVVKNPGFVIIYSGRSHGYIIPNRALNNQKKELYRFVSGKIRSYDKK